MYDINWKIGGIGGMGAMGVGLMFSKMLFRSGYFVCDYSEYNSIIKGGNNSYQVRVSSEKVHTISQTIDMLLALDEYSVTSYKTLNQQTDSFLLCDWALVKNKEGIDVNKVLDIPFSMINKSNGGDEIMKNMIGLGASLSILNADLDLSKQIIKEQFDRKGDDVVNKNILLFEAGYKYVKEKFADKISAFNKTHGIFNKLERKNGNVLVNGNEAIALAAISSGLGYYAAYPMTPSSSILHFLAPLSSKYNFVVKHVEDEIAGINSAIGASWGGARAMTATSGGGFSLMVEGLGLAAITETPIVIGVISRPGPSTGLPTWTDQGDLRFVLHASQGEFLRIVFTPGDPTECFELTKLAFTLSEKYHLPSIILSDKYLAEGKWSCQIDDNIKSGARNGFVNQAGLDRMTNYERYADTPSGVTPRSIPGMKNGEHLANSDEHNFYGLSDETLEMRNLQLEKRYTKKLKRLILDLPVNPQYGDLTAKVGIISFGSMKNIVLESLKSLKGIKLLHLKYASPFPLTDVKTFIESVDKIIVIENNMTGQLASLITENTGRIIDHKLLKDDGRPIYAEEVINFIKQNGY